MRFQVHGGVPRLLWKAHGKHVPWFLGGDTGPHATHPTTPSGALIVSLLVPGHVPQKTPERPQPHPGPAFSAFCPEKCHSCLCPRAREEHLGCTPFSGQAQGHVPSVWPPAPGPAVQSCPRKSRAPSPQTSSCTSAGRSHRHSFA